MRKYNIIILLFLFFGISIKSFSQEYLTQKEAVNDIDFFFKQAEQIHPELYFKISKNDLQKIISIEKEKIKDSISVNALFLKLTYLVNLISDGHTKVSPSKKLRDNYRKEKTQLPFNIDISKNKIFIKKVKTPLLKENDIILSINNIPTNSLLELYKLVSGDVESLKWKKFKNHFSYYLFIGYEFTDCVSIKVKRKDKIIFKTVKLLKKKENQNQKKYLYNTINDSIGLLKINAFWGINKKNYIHFLDSVFNDVKEKRINTLVIDLQNNGGGDSYYGALLFPYMNISKYRFNQKYLIKTSKPEKKYFRKRYIKWYMYPLYPFAYFHKTGRILFYKKNGTITDLKLKDDYLKVKDNAFNGKVYVLTSNNTYSAAADFVIAFKNAKRGQIIGDTLGQPYSGYIDMILVTLPNSKLKGGVSFKKYEYIGSNKYNYNQGIEPDIYFDIVKFKEENELRKKLIEIITNANKM
jgi:hypothetical protein